VLLFSIKHEVNDLILYESMNLATPTVYCVGYLKCILIKRKKQQQHGYIRNQLLRMNVSKCNFQNVLQHFTFNSMGLLEVKFLSENRFYTTSFPFPATRWRQVLTL